MFLVVGVSQLSETCTESQKDLRVGFVRKFTFLKDTLYVLRIDSFTPSLLSLLFRRVFGRSEHLFTRLRTDV